MHSASHYQALVVDITHEHRELTHRLRELRDLVDQQLSEQAIPAALVKTGESLLALRRQMELHFNKEEMGGVMEEAVARLPRLAETAASIQTGHPELLKSLDKAVRLTEKSGPKMQDWQAVRTAVNELVTAMLAHEATENRLLQQGFNEDLSAFQ